MKTDDALAAEQAVEAKLGQAGADQVWSHTFSDAPETTTAPQEGTPVEEVAAEARPRDEQGRFTTTTPEPETEEAAVEQQQTGDPAVSAFLAKYGGDVEKALAGAVHLQRKAGEQSNELGDLRRMVDELSNLTSAIKEQPQYVATLDQGTVDWFDQQVAVNPQAAIEWAASQPNGNLLVQRGIEAWAEMEPYKAAVYTTSQQNRQVVEQVTEALNKATKLPQDATINLALQAVRSRNPEFVNYDDALEQTMAAHPFEAEQFRAAAQTGDTTRIEGAIGTLYQLAVADTLRQIAQLGVTPDNTTETTGVATPTTSETREPVPAPSATDAFREQFRQEAERQNRGVWVAN